MQNHTCIKIYKNHKKLGQYTIHEEYQVLTRWHDCTEISPSSYSVTAGYFFTDQSRERTQIKFPPHPLLSA